MCLPFSASSEGRIRNLGLESKIGTFLGPFWHFGPIWDKVPNLGPFWSAWLFIAPKCVKGQNQLPFHTMKKMEVIVKPFLFYHTVLYTTATMRFPDAQYIKANPP